MRRYPKGPRRVRPRRRLPGGAAFNAGLTNVARKEDAPELLNEDNKLTGINRNLFIADMIMRRV